MGTNDSTLTKTVIEQRKERDYRDVDGCWNCRFRKQVYDEVHGYDTYVCEFDGKEIGFFNICNSHESEK